MENVFIHTLSNASFLRLYSSKLTGKCDLYYVEKKINRYLERILENKYRIKYINFHLWPDGFEEFQDMLYRWSKQLVTDSPISCYLKKYDKCFSVSWEYIENSLIKILVLLLRDDCKILSLGRNVKNDGPSVYLLVEHGLLKHLCTDLNLRPVSPIFDFFRNVVKATLFLLKSFNIVLRVASKKVTKMAGAGRIIFDQTYTFRAPRDMEFDGFYRYFKTRDDVIYNCISEGDDVYQLTLHDGKNPIVYRGGFLSTKSRLKVLRDILVLLKTVFSTKESISLKAFIVQLKAREIYFESMFSILKPAFYLKIRNDFDYYHPIATGLLENFGGKNIGYMCGGYANFNALSAIVDFHIYGLMGNGFVSKLFGNTWSRGRQEYLPLGPFTAYPSELDKTNKERLVIALYSTSVTDNYYGDEQFYDEFIASCYKVFSKENYALYFKPKISLNMKKLCAIEKSYRNKYDLKVNICLPSHHNDDDVDCYSDEIMSHADVIIVMSTSTISWEAISLKKKIIIYESQGNKHPFESVSSRLIVRNASELEESLKWLIAVPQKEYERLIAPIIDEWCVNNDGHLVDYFWRKVEGENHLAALDKLS